MEARPYDLLEDHLATADVLCWTEEEIAGGAHSHKASGLLSGGVWVIAKFAEDVPHGELAVRNEVAGYRIAQLFGWSDLVPCTVLRERLLSPQTENEGLASVQMLVPEAEHKSLTGVDEVETMKAAVFDIVVNHLDHDHNWLSVPEVASDHRHLYLYDNAMAFEYPGRGFNSRFAQQEHDGDGLSTHETEALERLLDLIEDSDLEDLIGTDGVANVVERAEALLEDGVIRGL